MTDDRLPLEGVAAPPMANGEVIFETPWQGRVFGMVRALCESGHYEWDEFRAELISEIDRWEENHEPDQPYRYFDHFLAALSNLLVAKGLCDAEELTSRIKVFEARPHGHDH